jgi:hypothetical protein
MFGKMKALGLKTAAATTVQVTLRESYRVAGFPESPGAMASAVVGRLLDQAPHLFTDSGHPRPHKLSIAALALAFGNKPELLPSVPYRMAFWAALRMVLEEIKVNGYEYPFHHLDMELIGKAGETYNTLTEELKKDPTFLRFNHAMAAPVG